MDKGKPKTTSTTPVNQLVVSWTPSGTPLSAIATGTSMASTDNPARQTSTPAINSSRDRDTAAQVSIRRSVDGQLRTEVPPWFAVLGVQRRMPAAAGRGADQSPECRTLNLSETLLARAEASSPAVALSLAGLAGVARGAENIQRR